jgi:ATP synthase protein I
MSEPGAGTVSERVNLHARSVRVLSSAMLRTAVWPATATVVLAAVVAGLAVGVSGLLGAVIGGAVVFASSLWTIWLMRVTSALHPISVMAAALGGYVLKMVVLLLVMTLLQGVGGIHAYALGGTMLASILVWAGAEAHAFRRARIPTVEPGSGAGQGA